MKVLLVSSNSGSAGGGEIYLVRLAEGLAAAGCEVHLLLAEAERMNALGAAAASFATVHRRPLTGTYDRRGRCFAAIADRRQRRAVALFAAGLGPGIVHVNQQVAEDGLDMLLAARASGLPTVTTIHIASRAADLGARFGMLRDRLAEGVVRRVAAPVIAVSAAAEATCRVRMGPRVACEMVRNGVPAAARLDPAERERLRAEWGARPGETVLLAAGRLVAQKNPTVLAAILARLREAGHPARLVWIGDGPLRPALLAAAREAGAADSLHIDGWRADVGRRLAAADVFVLPSLYEGMPLALLEAMRQGLPCCASAIPGVDEAIADGVDGFLCPPGDVGRWVARLSELAGDPALRRRLGEAAAARADRDHSIEAMAAATLAVYQREAARHSRAA